MRIASLSPAATEILFGLRLGKEHEVVCTDQFSNFPEEAKALPKLRGHDRIDADALQKYAPEIVLTGTVVQEKLATVLRDAGFAVVHQDPRTVQQIYESIRALGALFDRGKEAEALVLSIQQGFNDVKRKAAVLRGGKSSTPLGQEYSCPRGVGPTGLRVYIEEWHDPPFASGNWVPEITRIAGGRQFPIEDGALSRALTLEEVEQWNPELIVISWCGAGTLAPKELLLKRPGWDRLAAVQRGSVRVIDDSFLNRPGPRLVEGAQRLYGWLFEMLH